MSPSPEAVEPRPRDLGDLLDDLGAVARRSERATGSREIAQAHSDEYAARVAIKAHIDRLLATAQQKLDEQAAELARWRNEQEIGQRKFLREHEQNVANRERAAAAEKRAEAAEAALTSARAAREKAERDLAHLRKKFDERKLEIGLVKQQRSQGKKKEQWNELAAMRDKAESEVTALRAELEAAKALLTEAQPRANAEAMKLFFSGPTEAEEEIRRAESDRDAQRARADALSAEVVALRGAADEVCRYYATTANPGPIDRAVSQLKAALSHPSEAALLQKKDDHE